MTGILGVGLDLIDLQHFAVHYGDFDFELLARCFTDREISDIGCDADSLARLAGRFAVKEATYKALGGTSSVAHLDIETFSHGSGAPQLRLSGTASEMAKARGVATFLISISHSGSAAAAVVIACAGPA